MKFRIRSLIINVFICTLIIFSFFADLTYARTKNDFFVYLNTNSNGEENISELDFIKSNEGVMSLLGDGWILLYGGISLIAVSVAGIVFILIPKKRKNVDSRKKTSKHRNYNEEE